MYKYITEPWRGSVPAFRDQIYHVTSFPNRSGESDRWGRPAPDPEGNTEQEVIRSQPASPSAASGIPSRKPCSSRVPIKKAVAFSPTPIVFCRVFLNLIGFLFVILIFNNPAIQNPT